MPRVLPLSLIWGQAWQFLPVTFSWSAPALRMSTQGGAICDRTKVNVLQAVGSSNQPGLS